LKKRGFNKPKTDSEGDGMAKCNIDITILAHKHFCIFFIPFGKYTRVGEIAKLTIFGLPVYQRVGDAKQVLWWVKKPKTDSEVKL
jgi:hypothetical protein